MSATIEDTLAWLEELDHLGNYEEARKVRGELLARARQLERLEAACEACYVVYPNGARYEVGATLLSLSRG